MAAKYYLPIKSTSLAHYFGRACIVPSKYLENKPIDIQNKVENSLLLTNCIGVKDLDCYLELVLTESETKELINFAKGIFLFSKPLPISRVISVIFSDIDVKETTITSLELSSAFVPKKLIRVDKNLKFEELEINIADKNDFNWSDNISRLDRLLGGFALMRFSGENYMNYSENYFSTLSFFNEIIKTDLEVTGRQVKKLYHDAFIGVDSFKSLKKYLNKTITDDDLNEIAKYEGQLIIRNNITRIIDLSKLDKATYIVAVLNTYGVGKEARKKKIDGLILSNFKSELKSDKSEVISLCYGLNRGYSAFNNKYDSDGVVKHIKFKLDSQLDYYTIESLYQFAFNNVVSGSFPYLDKWCPRLPDSKIVNKSDYLILDMKVIGKKNPIVGSKEYLEDLLKYYLDKIKNVLFSTSSISDVISEIVEHVSRDKEDELEERVNIKNDILTKNFQLQLSKVDKILFDKIDKNEDGLLNSDEIAFFLQELKSSKSDVNIIFKNDDVQKVDENVQERLEQTTYEQEIGKILKLKNMSLSDFKKVAKSYNIAFDKSYKDKDDRDEMIIMILKKKRLEIPFN